MMDVFDGIRTLLAVRRYLDRPVPDTVIRKILEAGRLTGSAMNLQPWHFIVIQERETLRRLGAQTRSQPAERLPLLDHDEVPGLEVHRAPRSCG